MRISVRTLIDGDYAAAAALIAMGVLLGKASALQLSVMGLLMMPAYSLNFVICTALIKATDAGGSMVIHTFGAFFGLACVRLFLLCMNALWLYSIEASELAAACSQHCDYEWPRRS